MIVCAEREYERERERERERGGAVEYEREKEEEEEMGRRRWWVSSSLRCVPLVRPPVHQRPQPRSPLLQPRTTYADTSRREVVQHTHRPH
jgi:hypothetical protein